MTTEYLLQKMVEKINKLEKTVNELARREYTKGGGGGDMLKSVYDTDADNIVDAAETAPWSAITGKPSTFPPDSHTHSASDITSGTLSTDRFSAYNDLVAENKINSIAINALTGDVTASGTGSVSATIANNAVTLAKMADIATASLLGRNSAGSGDPEVLNAATVRSMINARERLTGDRTYYVRTDGNDSNTGFVNSTAGAFLTIQKAVDTIADLDINGKTVTVQVGDGTYNISQVTLKNVPGFSSAGNLVIQGNNSTPSNVYVAASSCCFLADGINSVWDVKDMKLSTSGSYSACLYAINSSTIRYGNIVFHTSSGGLHVFANRNGNIKCLSSYSITGGAIAHIFFASGGFISIDKITITLSGTPAFAAFAWAMIGGVADVFNNTYSGSATGKRYDIQSNSVIRLLGATLPGNTAGTTSTGGQVV